MTNIQTKTTTTMLILAASVLPAFGQNRGQHGWDRGSQTGERPQYQQQQRSSEQRNWQGRDQTPSQQAPQFQQQRQQFQQYQRPENFQQRQFTSPQQTYRQQDYREQRNFRPQGREYRDQSYRQQDYRRPNFYGGDSRQWQNNRRYGSFSGYRGYVIPQTRFYSSFGRDHFFRIGRPFGYGAYPRFQYGGYWFSFVSAPPAFWGPDWYDTDDVYLDYNDDGYYLYDSRYPDEGIPVEINN